MSAYKYRTNAEDRNLSQPTGDVPSTGKGVHQKRASKVDQPSTVTDCVPLPSTLSNNPFNSKPSHRNAQDCFVIESLKISGDALMGKVNDLIGQGNVHRIVIKNKEGHTLLSVPTTIKAMGHSLDTILSSEATAINIISAIVPYPKLVVEKFVGQYL